MAALTVVPVDAMSRALSSGPITDSRTVAQMVDTAWAHLFEDDK